MDPGYRAPTVILWATLDERNVLTVFAERVESELIFAAHVRALLDAPCGRPAWIGIDPSANQVNEQTGVSAARILEKAGLTVKRRTLPVQVGLDAVRARLKPADGPPRLLIHRRCTHLIEAMEKYHYDEKDLTSMDPVKDGPDHACDALRYLVTNLDLPATSKYLGNYLWR